MLMADILDQDDANHLERALDGADLVLVKKLSTNDRDWARLPNKHQAGVYIPKEQRESDFFPPLREKVRDEPDAAPIREVFFNTEWPQLQLERDSRLVHYTSKGEETHLTRLPKESFAQLPPASFFVMARTGFPRRTRYVCLTIDSESAEADMLRDIFSLSSEFVCDVLSPEEAVRKARSQTLSFFEEALAAYQAGRIAAFGARHASLPPPQELARMAREAYLARRGLSVLDPYALSTPGDAIREISRDIEWQLFKELQMKAKAVELIRLVLGDDPSKSSPDRVLWSIVENYQRLDALFLSASQQRKSRAGASFELQIEELLRNGRVPYERQVVLEAKKRPDFVMPGKSLLRSERRNKEDVLILSAKTTLKERWKQVQRELTNCDFFLATVDENVAGNAIEDMRALGVALVVPESLKDSDSTEYRSHPNVIDFASFFADIRSERMPRWIALGAMRCPKTSSSSSSRIRH